MIYCFDIDGTICTNTDGKYEDAEPYEDRIKTINELYKDAKIILFTARGTDKKKDFVKLTKEQLKKWGVCYDSLLFGKPEADWFVDDKGINDIKFFKEFKNES